MEVIAGCRTLEEGAAGEGRERTDSHHPSKKFFLVKGSPIVTTAKSRHAPTLHSRDWVELREHE